MNEKNLRISDAMQNTSEIKRKFYEKKGTNAVKQFQKNGFQAYYTPDRQEAAKLLLKLIQDQATVGVGDSHTVYSLDLDEALLEKKCRIIMNKAALNLHRYKSSDDKGYTKAPSRELARMWLSEYLTSNVYLLGANAITMHGEIVDVDGVGNHIAASLYGADRIIVIAGVNKQVPEESAARDRIRFIATPMNKIKYGAECPCVKTGICTDCHTPNRGCNITAVIHRRPIESDFHVILIEEEELGF